MDTHLYDGKLIDRKLCIERRGPPIATTEEKLIAFSLISQRLNQHPRFNGRTRQNFETIVNDFKHLGRARGPNYDSTNGLYADDMLYLCCKAYDMTEEKKDLIELLVCQFEEMTTGMCPQGRTHRLFQIAAMFY
jgi:hypothetical protein